MKRRFFLAKSATGILGISAVSCSDDKSTTLSPSSNAREISGVIYDSDGNGLQGVLIVVAGEEGTNTVNTDSEGAYVFEVTKNGEYTIFPNKEGYNFNPESQKLTITDSSEQTSLAVAMTAVLIDSNTYLDIPRGYIGTTDVNVSKFAFGSHVLSANVKNTVEREYVIRNAYERGVTTFDIYNAEGGAYQYEPMSRYLAPILYDVQLSMAMLPESGRTYEQEFDHMLKLFNRDYFDMVRLRARTKGGVQWDFWERLFELRDEGKVKAVGTAVHTTDDLDTILEYYGDELDYVFFPYNFYHNKAWQGHYSSEDYTPFVQTLRDRGIGVVTIKPFAGDGLVQSIRASSKELNKDVSLTQASLRYVINSGLNPDTTFAAMNHFREFDENIKAYIDPEMTEEETTLLDEVRGVMEKTAHLVLPDHYKFLNDWAPERSHLGKNNAGIKYS